jgi:hypothetical protein
MRIAIPHNTTKAKARQIIEKRLKNAEKQYGHMAQELDYDWKGDVLSLSGKAKGLSVKGTVEVTESDIIINGRLPLIAMPFEKKIRQEVEKEAESMFRTA